MTIHMQGKIEVVLRLIKTTFSDIWIKPTIVAQHLVIEMSVHKTAEEVQVHMIISFVRK